MSDTPKVSFIDYVHAQCDRDYAQLERELNEARAQLAEEKKMAFSLAAGQCIVDGGLVGDDWGSPYCTMRQRAETAEAQLSAQEELHRMQLVAISTATFYNTHESAKEPLSRDNPYWTVAYNDVCIAVYREICERERAVNVIAQLSALQAAIAPVIEKLETLRDGNYGFRDARHIAADALRLLEGK